MSHLGIIYEDRIVEAEVVEKTRTHLICKTIPEEDEFKLDADKAMQPLEKRDLKVGDKFHARIHPCYVEFAVLDWLES